MQKPFIQNSLCTRQQHQCSRTTKYPHQAGCKDPHGPFQLRIFYSSMILSWGQERDYLCWSCVSHVLDRQHLAKDETQQTTGRNTTRGRIHRSWHFPAPVSQFWIFTQLLKVVPRLMEGSVGNQEALDPFSALPPSWCMTLIHFLSAFPCSLFHVLWNRCGNSWSALRSRSDNNSQRWMVIIKLHK